MRPAREPRGAKSRHLLGKIIMIDGFISRISVMDRSKAHNLSFLNTQAPSSTDPATKNVRSNRTPAPFFACSSERPAWKRRNPGSSDSKTTPRHRGGLKRIESMLNNAGKHAQPRSWGSALYRARSKIKKLSSAENRPCTSPARARNRIGRV